MTRRGKLLDRIRALEGELAMATKERQLKAARELPFHGRLVPPRGPYVLVEDLMGALGLLAPPDIGEW